MASGNNHRVPTDVHGWIPTGRTLGILVIKPRIIIRFNYVQIHCCVAMINQLSRVLVWNKMKQGGKTWRTNGQAILDS